MLPLRCDFHSGFQSFNRRQATRQATHFDFAGPRSKISLDPDVTSEWKVSAGRMFVDKPLRIHAFAALTGVTVRALHHYDRIGLLRPHRSAAGYRLYGTRELERLEQIVALRFIGVPLKQMGRLLNASELAEVLPRQRAM